MGRCVRAGARAMPCLRRELEWRAKRQAGWDGALGGRDVRVREERVVAR